MPLDATWDKFKLASEAFRASVPDLKDINVIFFFGGSVPPQRQHTDFMNEIAAFVSAHRHELTPNDTDYDPRHFFSTPLMSAHLQALYLRICPYAEWKTNLDAGFVATATTSLIPDIVARKSAEQFRPTDELWIAIQSTRELIAVWKRATAIYRGVEAQRDPFQGAAYHAKRIWRLRHCQAEFSRIP